MNIEKLREIRNRAYKDSRHTVRDLIDALLEDNPPESPDGSPRVDRSLRGWVLVNDHAPYWAAEDGIRATPHGAVVINWDAVREGSNTVRKLTPQEIGFKVRRWDEWTEKEQWEYMDSVHKRSMISADADLAIDIALRGNYE